MDEAEKSKDEAAKLRKDAKALYERGTKDRQLALKVLSEATTVLTKSARAEVARPEQRPLRCLGQPRTDPPGACCV